MPIGDGRKTYSDSTLKSMTKDALIDFIRCLETNLRNSYEENDIQREICKKLFEEEKGKFIRVPCDVGDLVYVIAYNYEKEKYEIKKTEIIEIKDHCNGWFFVPSLSRPAFRSYDFGKTVFLTKEEAEEKMKTLIGKK